MPVTQAVAAAFQGKNEHGFLYLLGPDFPAFAGHFEGHPVLPAVCQMSLCAHAAGQLLGAGVQLAQVMRSKFIKPVVPGMLLQVCLNARGADSFMAELTDAKTGQKISQIIFSIEHRGQA